MTDEPAFDGPVEPINNGPIGAPIVFCCKMREKHIVSVVAVNHNLPDPPDIIDFLDFDNKSPKGHPIIYMAFCPWCGSKLPRNRSRLIDLSSDDDDSEKWKAGTVD